MTKQQQTERDEALTDIRRWLNPGDTVYTITRSVSRTGMSRNISVVAFIDGCAIHPNWSVARATGYPLNRGGVNDSIVVKGCGFNQGRAIVDALSRELGFPLQHEAL